MSNFYIVGTKYGEYYNDDITPYLLKKQAIAIGFCWGRNLENFYNGDLDSLTQLLQDAGEKPTTIEQVKRFISLQPGDIIALKGVGSPIRKTARLEIIGYAVVTERHGIVYKHDPNEFPKGLGHLINVDFLEFGIKRTFQLGYGRSIHKLKKKEHIDLIFGSYAEVLPIPDKPKGQTGTKQKNTSEISVTVSANYIRKAVHNKIQQGFYDLWVELFGENSITMEENFIDMIITTKGTTELIEVKPYTTATQCIREGLGQLLSYYHKHYSNNSNILLKIIGSNEPNLEDKKFIKFIQRTMNIGFKYDSWQRISSRKQCDNF